MGNRCDEEQGKIVFANDHLELTFDRATGRWLTLRDLSTGEVLLHEGGRQAVLVLTVNGVTTATRGRDHWWSVLDVQTVGAGTTCNGYACSEDDRGITLTVHTEEGDWLIDQRYTLPQGLARVERGLRIAYRGEGTALLRAVDLRLPPATLGPVADCFVEVPCYATKAHQPLGAVPYGDWWDRINSKSDISGAPGWKPGLIGLDNPSRNLSLAAWAYSEIEPSILRVRRGDQGTHIVHTAMLCNRFRQGDALDWQGQYVQVFRQPWLEALGAFQEWYDAVGLQAVPDVPPWARAAHIYELFIGGSERRQTRYPDFDTLIADLPRIKDLGFDAVEVMPHMPFPSYSVVDYYDVETHYGSAEGLKQLTARAHEMGMHVLLDVIVHGVVDREALAAMRATSGASWLPDERLPQRHPYRDEHPEWFAYTEFGTPAATYTWSFDHANASWRDFMVDVVKHYVSAYDVDGFRVDALTWNYFPNWAEGLPYRASACFYASASLTERIREEVRRIKPDVVFYTETTGPLFTRSYDLGYNYDMQWLFSGLLPPISPRGFAWSFSYATERLKATDVGPWLEQRRLARPRGAITVHHLDSHDTNEWGGLMQYRREAFGEEAAQALFALCCSMEGGIMMFSGAEEGAEGFYRTMLHLRRETAALELGTNDYGAIQVDDPRVYAVLRVSEGDAVIPVINLANRQTRVSLSIAAERLPVKASSYRLMDLYAGQTLQGADGEGWGIAQLGRVALELAPFQFCFIKVVPA